jgi:hypothetical protein
VATKVNEVVDDSLLLHRYEIEIAKLRKQIKLAGRAQQQVKALNDENATLKQEVERLTKCLQKNNVTVPEKDSEHVHQENIQIRMHKKLGILEEIEMEQKQREKELDGYHVWLHSIPVQYDGEQQSLDIKDRLQLMEKSVALQQKELVRTKKLFIRDIKIVKDELAEKNNDLEEMRGKMELKEQEIAKLQNELEHAKKNVVQVPVPTQKELPKEKVELVAVTKAVEQQRKASTEKATASVHAFRTDLTSMLHEHLEDVLSREISSASDVIDEFQELVDGCSEALEETVGHCLNDLGTAAITALLRLKEVVSTPASVPAPTVNTSTNDEILNHVKESFKHLETNNESLQAKQYWQRVTAKAGELQEFQSKIYIFSVTMKNSLSRLLTIISKFEKDKSDETLEYHKQYMENVLSDVIRNIEQFEQQTFSTKKDKSEQPSSEPLVLQERPMNGLTKSTTKANLSHSKYNDKIEKENVHPIHRSVNQSRTKLN